MFPNDEKNANFRASHQATPFSLLRIAKIDYEINNRRWGFGHTGCILEKLLDLPCGVVSCAMLTYLAVDRAAGIGSSNVLPENTKRKRRLFYLQLLVFWLFW